MGIFDFFRKKKEVNKYSKQLTSNVVKSMKKSSKASYSGPTIDPILKKKLNNGLLPGEIILINWINNRVEPLSFPRYFTNKYDINPNRKVKHLLKEGYIQQGNSANSLKGLKVIDLKEKLAVKNLPTSRKNLN